MGLKGLLLLVGGDSYCTLCEAFEIHLLAYVSETVEPWTALSKGCDQLVPCKEFYEAVIQRFSSDPAQKV